jgi:hypothetical protein
MGWTDRVNVGGSGGADFLRVGAVGLPPKEELLLRSVVRVLEAQTRRRWEFAETPPYHVTFVGTGLIPDSSPDNPGNIAETSGIAVRVLPAGTRPDVDSPDITLPIRPLNLLPLLDSLGDRLRPASAQAASATPAAAAASARRMSLGLPPSAETFVTRVRKPGAGPFEVIARGQPLIVVDPARGIWSFAAGLDEHHLRLPDLATQFLTPGLDYVDHPANEDAPPTAGSAQRLEALLWHIGLRATPGEALRPVAARSVFRLTRWPDFGSIGSGDVLALKLAALLVSRAHRLDELIAAGREPRDRMVDILNACALCDLLSTDVSNKPAAVGVVADTRRQAGATRRYGLVLQALRSALGIK